MTNRSYDTYHVIDGPILAEVNHDLAEPESDDAWPWDPTRPVAGQYEEHVAQVRLEQTRHDVAASVARHADAEPKSVVDYAVAALDRGDEETAIASGIEVDLIVGDEPEQGVEFEIDTDDRPAGWDRDPDLDAMEREHTRVVVWVPRDDDALLAEIAHAPPREPAAGHEACKTCGRLPDEACDVGALCPRAIPKTAALAKVRP